MEASDAPDLDEAEITSAPSEQRKRKKAPPKGGKRRRTAARKRKPRRRHPVRTAVLILLLVLVLGAVGAAGYMTYRISLIDTVYPGVAVEGVELGGMTRQQASDALMQLGAERYDGLSVTANLPLDNTLTITGEEAGLAYSADAAVQAAWNYGRGGSMLANAVDYVKAEYLHQNDFALNDALEVSLDADAIRAIVAEAKVDIDEQLLQSGIDIGEGEIRITKGASGLTLDEEAVVSQFTQALLSGSGEGFTYESAPQPDEKFDFQGLYDELYAEKAEAQIFFATDYDEEGNVIPWEPWVTPDRDRHRREKPMRQIPELPEGFDFNGEPYAITRSVVGVSFDVAEAERLWAQAGYGETVVIPLVVDEPEMSTEDYESMLFADVLSKNWTMVKIYNRDYADECRTTLSGSSSNRISNVKKACGLLDGLVLMPGEIFSYNDAIGERLAENGWLPAPAYANGEVRQENGGGICQVSSTLYNAVMYADLEIVERECHQFQVGYLPWGMDATVSWGWPDFKFRNNNEYPIMIHSWVDEATNECCVQIKGTDTEHIYVVMRFSYAERADTSGKYHDANGNSLAVGMNAATWRRYYHDGEDFNTTDFFCEVYEFYSQYNYHTEDIEARNVPLPAAPAAEESGET